MNATNKPDKILLSLCENATLRKARSLRLIHEICTEQQDRGSNDFSIATIGRLSAARGGPAAGAIRNRSGEAYRALISSFRSSGKHKAPKRSSSAYTQADLILEGVTDPVLCTRIRLLLAELQSTRGQLLAAKSLANGTLTLQLTSSLPGEPTSRPSLDLTLLELRALKGAISPETMEHWGWATEQNGRVKSENGRTVFAAGFVTGIQKVLQYVQSTEL